MHGAALCRDVAEQFEGSAGSSEGSELLLGAASLQVTWLLVRRFGWDFQPRKVSLKRHFTQPMGRLSQSVPLQ